MALRVQRLYGRSIVNFLHGVWSIGAVLGGLMGSAAAGLHLPLGIHLTISAVLFSTVTLVACRFTLPGPDDATRTTDPATTADPTGPGDVGAVLLPGRRGPGSGRETAG